MLESKNLVDSPITGDLFAAKREEPNAEFDITAMIDLVFMMNIYFLVTFLTVALGELDLPTANHVSPLDIEEAVVISVLPSAAQDGVAVYLGNGKEGDPILEPALQQQQIAEAVEKGKTDGKKAVLIKAERAIRLREIGRLGSAAGIVEMPLHIAVLEKDEAP